MASKVNIFLFLMSTLSFGSILNKQQSIQFNNKSGKLAYLIKTDGNSLEITTETVHDSYLMKVCHRSLTSAFISSYLSQPKKQASCDKSTKLGSVSITHSMISRSLEYPWCTSVGIPVDQFIAAIYRCDTKK